MPKPISASKSVVAVTMGDPGGIGPEIILKTFAGFKNKKAPAFVIIGSYQVFSALLKKLRLKINIHLIDSSGTTALRSGRLFFCDVSERAARYLKSTRFDVNRVQAGRVCKVNAAWAFAALDYAAEAALQGRVQAIVTAPVNKTSMRLIQPGFTGHTEYLARKAKTNRFAMFFHSEKLKVTLATIHVALKEVSGCLSEKLICEKIMLTDEFFKKRLRLKKPRIAVCALNPHGRETGREEDRILVPAVKRMRRKGIHVTGPFSADELFYEAYHGRYDALISMYHDQALTAFKMIALKEGVNVTLGLPFVRTSPDHGTAFDIAWRAKADESSMVSAVRLAEKLI
ncbi:MAG: 4-hydroxythreonine-4-phosphate dehydrogenase PdxA [Candidatus Omnitrophica bacterium]|nr:4-hydroxythreonine-4-phosphate dehydrogenase PdxA [Candidatus Omnitrophota bacterium]